MLRTGTKVRLVFFSPFHGQEQNEDNNCLLLHGQNTKNMTGVSRPKTTRRRGRYRHEAGGEGNSKEANRKKRRKTRKKKLMTSHYYRCPFGAPENKQIDAVRLGRNNIITAGFNVKTTHTCHGYSGTMYMTHFSTSCSHSLRAST